MFLCLKNWLTQVRRKFLVEFYTIKLTLHSWTNDFTSTFPEKYIEFLTRCDFVSGFSGKMVHLAILWTDDNG